MMTQALSAPPYRPNALVWCAHCRSSVEPIVMLDRGDETKKCGACGSRLDRSARLGSVLVAEDSDVMRQMLAQELRGRGMASEVVEVKDGRDLLVAVADRVRKGAQIGLLIVDINLPGMNGIEASKAIRALERGMGTSRRTPILFFSGLKYSDGIRRLVEFLGSAGFLHKGNEPDVRSQAERLFRTLEQILAKEARA